MLLSQVMRVESRHVLRNMKYITLTDKTSTKLLEVRNRIQKLVHNDHARRLESSEKQLNGQTTSVEDVENHWEKVMKLLCCRLYLVELQYRAVLV